MKQTPRRTSSKGQKSGISADSQIHHYLTTYIGYCLHKVALRWRAHLDASVASYGLVTPQYGMLMILKIEGVMTQIELGEFMAMDKATMVRMLDGLEQRGYLKRVVSSQDRRAKDLQITPAGEKILARLEKVRAQEEKVFFSPLTPAEQEQLRTLSLRVLTQR